MTHAPHAMSCGEMVVHLSDYLDGDLRSELRNLIDQHCGHCPPCEAFIRTLARTVEVVRAQPREPLPDPLRAALVEALRKARRDPGTRS